jgi:hypothetical protein
MTKKDNCGRPSFCPQKRPSSLNTVCAESFQHKYEEILKKYNEEFTFANKLREDLLKKQGNYIKREQDYRNTIEKLKNQIDDIS